MDTKFYPLYHAVRDEEYTEWEAHRLSQVWTLCGQLCLDYVNTNRVYDTVSGFIDAPYMIVFRNQEYPVSSDENTKYIKCPKCMTDAPLAVLGDLP